MDDDDFNEFIDLPPYTPRLPAGAAEGRPEIGLGMDGASDEELQPDGSRRVTDRRGRSWHVSELEQPAVAADRTATGAATEVMLRFVHFGIVLRADGAPAEWRALPSTKLLALAGLD